LDLSRKRLDVHLVDEGGATKEVTAVSPDADALRTLVRSTDRYREPVRVAIERVLHSAPCSVLIAQEAPPEEGPARILVGVDGSAGSLDALSVPCGTVDARTCDVTVLSAAPVPYPRFAGGHGIAYATTAYASWGRWAR
jgi:hypothetical protein